MSADYILKPLYHSQPHKDPTERSPLRPHLGPNTHTNGQHVDMHIKTTRFLLSSFQRNNETLPTRLRPKIDDPKVIGRRPPRRHPKGNALTDTLFNSRKKYPKTLTARIAFLWYSDPPTQAPSPSPNPADSSTSDVSIELGVPHGLGFGRLEVTSTPRPIVTHRTGRGG